MIQPLLNPAELVARAQTELQALRCRQAAVQTELRALLVASDQLSTELRTALGLDGAAPDHLVAARVCSQLGHDLKTLRRHSRKLAAVRARAAVWSVLREHHGWSYQRIANAFGYDHGTVMHALSKDQGPRTKDQGPLMKMLSTIHRQVAAENAIGMHLKAARSTSCRSALLTELREIGRLMATELALLQLGQRAAWIETLQRRTGITLAEMELASMAWRTHVSKAETRRMSTMRN